MSIETLLAELANEHTALHVNYDVARVRRLQQEAADAGAFFTCFSVAGTRSIYDLFDLVGEYLQFPEPTRNAEAVRDWATDLEFIDNEAGYVIVINDCQSLKDLRSEDLDLFFWLWPGGPAAFQFQDQIYHVLFTGPESIRRFSVKETLTRRAKERQFSAEYVKKHGGRSNRIPVIDWLKNAER